MRILACAVGFGLGPSGKLCSIIDNNKDYEWYACGDELDLSVYEKNPFIDRCWSRERDKLYTFIKTYSLQYAVNVLDPELAIMMEEMGVRVLYIDSLSFMWTQADLIPDTVWAYCSQKYPGYTLNPVLNSVKNHFWVDPIVPVYKATHKGEYIVVNFGGLHSPFGNGEEYFKLIMEGMMDILSQNTVYITGGRNVVELSQKLYPQFCSGTYSHVKFLELVSGASLFLTSPGLTTVYETCRMNIKTIILPPQNLSQFYNTGVANGICREVKTLDWNYKMLTMQALKRFNNCPEEETVKYIYKQIRYLSKNEAYQREFKNYIHRFMTEPFSSNDYSNLGNEGLQQVSKVLAKMMGEA